MDKRETAKNMMMEKRDSARNLIASLGNSLRNSMKDSFVEPTGGFKALMSKWKKQDKDNEGVSEVKSHIAALARSQGAAANLSLNGATSTHSATSRVTHHRHQKPPRRASTSAPSSLRETEKQQRRSSACGNAPPSPNSSAAPTDTVSTPSPEAPVVDSPVSPSIFTPTSPHASTAGPPTPTTPSRNSAETSVPPAFRLMRPSNNNSAATKTTAATTTTTTAAAAAVATSSSPAEDTLAPLSTRNTTTTTTITATTPQTGNQPKKDLNSSKHKTHNSSHNKHKNHNSNHNKHKNPNSSHDKHQNQNNNAPAKTTTTKREEAKKLHLAQQASGELDPVQAKNAMRQPMNVYQKPLSQEINGGGKPFKPPCFAKSEEESIIITTALSNSFVFNGRTEAELLPLVTAFEKYTFSQGETIIHQGEPGDYFYIIHTGQVRFQLNGRPVGQASRGMAFGELALLYTSPSAASVVATVDSELFRVGQETFRYILRTQAQKAEQDKIELLRQVNFLKNLTEDDLHKLVNVMTLQTFRKDELLVRKGAPGHAFYIVNEGEVMVENVTMGSSKYKDFCLGRGEHFGERAFVTDEPRESAVRAATDGSLYWIDRETFEKVLGSIGHLVLKAIDVRRLSGIQFIQNARLTPTQLDSLANRIDDNDFPKKTIILRENQLSVPSLYLVREGRVVISFTSKKKPDKVIEAGGYFGQSHMLSGAKRRAVVVKSPYTVVALDDCKCGLLTLTDCRKVFNTDNLLSSGKPSLNIGSFAPPTIENEEIGATEPPSFQGVVHQESAGKEAVAVADAEENESTENEDHPEVKVDEDFDEHSDLKLTDLRRHAILGEGTFGQVWLTSTASKEGTRQPYALKIMSKHELAKERMAEAIMREKEVMTNIRHPFTTTLIKTFQDEYFLYMLIDFVQGGELFSVVHRAWKDSKYDFPESQAKFYALAIADALAHLHNGHYLYRDLKPENVLIDSMGYPRLIDFGFAKHVTDKTYTLCGTPGYLAPEVVMSRGHNAGADHWSLGILIYELLMGENPFYFDGIEQLVLFESIVKDDYEKPQNVSPQAVDIVAKLLVKDPNLRLGSLARGESEILEHPWFADLDLQAMRRRELTAPWVPEVKDPLDGSCFDDWSGLEDKTHVKFPALSQAQDTKLFGGFT